jgi:hypothetical protein
VPIEVVSKRLGHSSIAVTVDVYGHLLEGVGHHAAEASAALVPRSIRPGFQHRCDQSVTHSAIPEDGPRESRDVCAGQRLSDERARRDSNPQPSDP